MTHASIVNVTPSVNSSKGKTRMQWLITFLVNITVLSYGLQTGWIACMAKVLQSAASPIGAPLTPTDISWLASSPSLAAMLSIPMWTVLVDRIGRKPSMITCSVLQIVAWVFIWLATSMWCLMVGRLLGGMAGAGCVYCMPIYVKEVSQDDIRGALGMVLNMARNLGILFMYIMGGYMSYYSILWLVTGVAVVGALATSVVPESPTYYVKTGRPDVAASTIAYLRNLTVDAKVVQNALDSIKAEDEKFKSLSDVSLIGVFRQKAWRKGFIFMVLVMLGHGLNGGFTIVNYAPSMLEMFHVTVNVELQSLSVPVCMITGSVLAMLFIERLGRRPILVVSFFLAMVSFAALAALSVAQRHGTAVPSWAAVLSLIVPVFTYAAAVSPMPFVLMPEIFNFQIRAKAMCCLCMLGWTGAFLQVLVYGPVSEAYGAHVCFIAFTVVNLFGTLVVLVLLPETKNKSIEQIEMELEKKLERK